MTDTEHPRVVRMVYTNYRGETSIRTVTPTAIYWGSNKYHPQEQWLMAAYCHDKNAPRDFALCDCDFTKTGD